MSVFLVQYGVSYWGTNFRYDDSIFVYPYIDYFIIVSFEQTNVLGKCNMEKLFSVIFSLLELQGNL